MHLLQLPVELHLEISDYLSQRDRAAICSVNKKLRPVYTKLLYSADSKVTLLWAADKGLKETAGLTLDHGAKINSTEEKKHRTALQLTAWAGHLPVLKLLLDSGANVSPMSISGYSALHNAANRGWDDAVRLLLRHGADVSLSTRETPIYLATYQGHSDVIKTLLDYGADLKIT